MTDKAPPKCHRCGKEFSVFWWRFSMGCDEYGDDGKVFSLCDLCMIDFVKFMGEAKQLASLS